MGRNYYYLISSLPILNFGEFETIPVEDLLEKIVTNLSVADQGCLAYLRKERDIQNLHSFEEDWETFRALGNIPTHQFINPDEELKLPEEWNSYVLSQKGDKPIPIDTVWLNHFAENNELKCDFICAWIEHEMALRMAVAIMREEKQKTGMELTVSDEVVSSENPVLQELLQNSRLPNLGVSYRFDWADHLRETFQTSDPYEFERALDQIRWNFLDGWIANRHFAREVVFAYVLKLMICERWQRLDQDNGEQIIHRILGGTSGE